MPTPFTSTWHAKLTNEKKSTKKPEFPTFQPLCTNKFLRESQKNPSICVSDSDSQYFEAMPINRSGRVRARRSYFFVETVARSGKPAARLIAPLFCACFWQAQISIRGWSRGRGSNQIESKRAKAAKAVGCIASIPIRFKSVPTDSVREGFLGINGDSLDPELSDPCTKRTSFDP